LAAFSWSTQSLMTEYRSWLRRARSSTSSVVTVVRPACRLKLSRSVATFSATHEDQLKQTSGCGHARANCMRVHARLCVYVC
jgi:hypothetical protein